MASQLDHDGVERVVRRALELEQRTAAAADDGFHVEAIVAAATEAGIEPGAIHEAIAWERLGPEPRRRALDGVVGRGAVAVERTIDRPLGALFGELDTWLTVGHHLRRDAAERLADGDGARLEWSKRGDLAASMQRSVRGVAGGAALGSVRRLRAELIAVDADRTLVRLVGDRRAGRNAALATSGGVGAASIAGGAMVGASLAVPLAVVAAPGMVVAGGTAVASRRRSSALARELRRLLDQLDAGERPVTIVGGVAQRLGLRRA